jgi:hypothetical protein
VIWRLLIVLRGIFRLSPAEAVSLVNCPAGTATVDLAATD